MEGCSDPIDASSTRRYGTDAWWKPPWLGEGEQNNQSLISVPGTVPLKYCPPTCMHMAKTEHPATGQTKGPCAPKMFYSFSALMRKQAQLFCCPGLSAALPLCSGNCKEGLGLELQRGAGTLFACRTWCSTTRATAPPPQA